MAAVRRQTAYLIPTIMGGGSARICDLPGTVTMGGSHSAGGTNPYFLLQKGVIGFQYGGASAAVYALLDGSAVGAGTIGVFVVQPNSTTPFDFTVGGGPYEGVAVKNPGGLWMHPTTDLANHGTISGTVSVTVKIRDVLQ